MAQGAGGNSFNPTGLKEKTKKQINRLNGIALTPIRASNPITELSCPAMGLKHNTDNADKLIVITAHNGEVDLIAGDQRTLGMGNPVLGKAGGIGVGDMSEKTGDLPIASQLADQFGITVFDTAQTEARTVQRCEIR